MSLDSLLNRLHSVKVIGFLSPILISIIITLPLYLTGEHAIKELAQSLTKELFSNELNQILGKINDRFEKLKIVGLEDSEEHKEAIQMDALKRFSEYSYKNTGSMFTIDNHGQILIGQDIPKQVRENIIKASTSTHTAKVIQYQQNDKKRWGVMVFYEPWQYYIGITIDENELFDQTIIFQNILLFMMAVSLLIAIWAVIVSKHIFITPLTQLTQYAEDIANGRYETQISGNFYWEFKTLKNAMGSMVVALVQRLQQIHVQLELIMQREQERNMAIRQTEQGAERLNVTLRAISDAVIAYDLTGNITIFNKTAEKILGIRQEEALGQPISLVLSMLSPATSHNNKAHLHNSLNYIGQYELKNKSGNILQVSCTSASIKDPQSQPIETVIVIRDITTYLNLLNEQNKIQKLESLGLLAGGIAHDFNNLLTSIMAGTSMARQLLRRDGQRAEEYLQKAEKALERAVGLTHQLLTFAKGGEPIKQAASLKELLVECAEFILTGSATQCEYHFQDRLWLANIDKNQISQVVQNILLNARQAMNDSGIIWITCENFEKTEVLPMQYNGLVNTAEEWNRLCPFALPQWKYLKLSIADNGPGIPKHILARIFEPYFTTKAHGNGLGLAISHSIINKHGGCIVVESVEGKGTVFTIYLPAIEAEQSQQILDIQPIIKTPATHRRILIMDDDPMILELVSMLLQELGYEVLTASNGEEALAIYENTLKSERPVDIIIMDITVKGGLGARETMPKLLKLNPNVKAVVSSGYSKDPIMANYQEYGFTATLPKPYRIQKLANLLEQIADTAQKE